MPKYIHHNWCCGPESQPQWYSQGYWWNVPDPIWGALVFYPGFSAGYNTRLEAILCIRRLLRFVDPFLVAIHVDNIKIFRFYQYARNHRRVRYKYTHRQSLTPAEKRFVTRRNT